MLGVERLDGIMEMLKDGQAVSIHTLSKALYISESTLRRDLAALQKEGLIRRIRGGAILAANNRDVPRLIRENEAPDIKNIIGARAAELVHPGDVILLAGKGHETEQEIGKNRIPLDEREEIASFFRWNTV